MIHAPGAAPSQSFLRRVIEGWALLGGVVLLAVVAVNVRQVAGGVAGLPFAGDFELTEIGVAVAAFMFLPYCQLVGGNVTADVFTARAGPRTLRVLRSFGSIAALCLSALLLWRMTAGMIDQKTYALTSAILQIPIWWVYLPILASLALLGLAAVATLRDDVRARD